MNLTPEAAVRELAARMFAGAPRGTYPSSLEELAEATATGAATTLRIDARRAWGVNGTLSVRLNVNDHAHPTAPERAAGANWSISMYRGTVEVSWSSTGRSVAAATAALALYRELVELGAELEAVLGEMTIALLEGEPDRKTIRRLRLG